MSIPIDTFKHRLQELLTTKGIIPADLAKNTGISPATVSKYLHGTQEAKQDKIAIISKTYNVDPAWLMGYDVPMQKLEQFNTFDVHVPQSSGQIQRLLAYATKLSAMKDSDREMIEGMIDRLSGGDSNGKKEV